MAWRAPGGGGRSALPHFSQHRPDALLGLAGQTFLAALLAFEPLHRDQKPRCLWFAIDHGDRSFRVVRSGKLSWCGNKGAPRSNALVDPRRFVRLTSAPSSAARERPALISSIPIVKGSCNRVQPPFPIFPLSPLAPRSGGEGRKNVRGSTAARGGAAGVALHARA